MPRTVGVLEVVAVFQNMGWTWKSCLLLRKTPSYYGPVPGIQVIAYEGPNEVLVSERDNGRTQNRIPEDNRALANLIRSVVLPHEFPVCLLV